MADEKKSEDSIDRHLLRETLRFTFCAVILASFFGALNLKSLSNPATHLALEILGVSAGFSFLYLLSVAAALKYKNPMRIDRFILSKKVTGFFYDTSINVFGLALIVWVTEKIIQWFGLNVTFKVIPLFIVLFSTVYFFMRVIWALLRRLIEYYYENISQ